jgi:hypothetical protein
MDGSMEDDQASYTRNSYWGATKKACSIDQYRAPPMNGSKDGLVGAPAAVPARIQGPAGPAAVHAGAPATAAVP